MIDEQILFESEGQEKIESVVRFLRQLADAMSQRGKHVRLRKGDDVYTFAVPDMVSFEVELEEEETNEGRVRELEIEIEWLEAAVPAGADEEE